MTLWRLTHATWVSRADFWRVSQGRASEAAVAAAKDERINFRIQKVNLLVG